MVGVEIDDDIALCRLSSFLCFTLSTIVIVILVFILSVVLALFLMRCYNLYRSNYQVRLPGLQIHFPPGQA